MSRAPSRRVMSVAGACTAIAVAAVALLFAWGPGGRAIAAVSSVSPLSGMDSIGTPTVAPVSPNQKMLVEADDLVYDYDNDVVAAVGNVKIYYGGYTLQADKVTYNRKTGRLVATSRVTLVSPTGDTYYSDYLDVTEDFAEGFVESLRVNTAQSTYFAADNAVRTGGNITTFERGVYTACAPCKEHPERPSLWDVKAATIISDQKKKRIYFRKATVEFFGLPVAWFPYLSVPDPTVSRATGFLVPNMGYGSRIGAFLSVPYFWALAPNYDITFTPTVLAQQGLLTDVEWRHTYGNLTYAIQAAGIYQLQPDNFPVGSAARTNWRGGISSAGTYSFNKDWTLGWNGTLLSDRGFGRDYGVFGQGSDQESSIYLTGLRGENYFHAESAYYQILTEPTAGAQYAQDRQGWVAPVIDYQRIANDVFGGQLTFTTNFTNVVRDSDDPFKIASDPLKTVYYAGVAGDAVRGTEEVDWQRRFVGPFGQLITPFASVRGDLFYNSGTSASAVTGTDSATRFMPAVGVEWSWPLLVAAGNVTQIIEPVAQVIARPDETGIGTLPNNDAQSLVFDSSNLFTHDKFSGFDRVEGGTRANLGVRYHLMLANGASVDATAGQSIQLAGENSFTNDPLSAVGYNSGLQDTFSDYVAGTTIDSGRGATLNARGRFDHDTFALNRGELEAAASFGPGAASLSYLYDRVTQNRLTPTSVIRGAASLTLAENWRTFGSVAYDLNTGALASDGLGFAFDNDCVTLSVAYGESRFGYSDAPDRWVNVRLALRTFAEQNVTSSLN